MKYHAAATPHVMTIPAESLIADLERVIHDFEEVYLTFPGPPWAIYRAMRGAGRYSNGEFRNASAIRWCLSSAATCAVSWDFV